MLVTSRETRRWIIPKGWPKKGRSPHRSAALGLLRARSERPRRRRAAECSQQFPPSNGDCHTPLPCEVRKGISGLISRDLSSAAPLHFVSKP
jgi:hypothetical protein